MLRSVLLMICLTVALPGCAALSALQGEPNRDVFELRSPPAGIGACRSSGVAELVIELPKTRGTLDSERIMIRPSDLQTQYLPDAIWGDTVPVTLQRLLVETLGNYGAFTHVGRAPLGISGDYALLSEIRHFNAQTTENGALIRLDVVADLVREMDATVVSRGRFSATTEAAGTRTRDLIPAFDLAAQQLVAEMAEWALRGVGVDPNGCN
ncbi:ABC-type transport auxiliary lipoprotein family protein [Paracoccus aerodenitrificans]|uniref:ABC-type transport auxiliary lipoprotein family protein n=1 Tax=Paracoccus aerodenitrificans TaxID=3017781 RepID=UPI0022F11405|nr:ABC-type transport auxiliary lipoprotein family protein [Paracoccus aerodenitrificans]WBU63513.1 ABC-type transport auxiliary lipoprotein family protein [Paracoccus aerodenitrificans]